MGVVAAVAGAAGAFNTEDLWVLSTAATHAAVALTNGRLFELVRRGKAEWETAFDALAEGLVVVDHLGKIVRANRGLERILGRDVTALAGAAFAPLVGAPPEQVDALVGAAPGAPPATLVVRSPGRGRVLRLTGASAGSEGGTSALVVLVEDVTDQRALEGQLIQSEKMAAVGQLVSGIAHELNNPLTSIAGLSELLLEQARIPEESRDHLRVIQAQAERAGRIVQNLLTFARKGTPERTPTDLNDVASRTALLIAYELRLRGIALEETLADGPVMVLADRYELQQVALNLLTNAVQAVAAARASGGVVRIETALDDATATLRVFDNGAGVSAEHVSQLFTPFFTTKDPGQGTGLGLSISYGIVEAHGGRLAYAPAPEGGSVFSITLPRHRAAVPVAAPAGRTILLVDDDPKHERLVAALFARDGYAVEAVRNVATALARLARGGVDLVVADAQLAAPGGGTVAGAILGAHPDLRERLIVAVPRGAPGTADRLRAEGHRVVPYPYELKALRAAAEEALGQ
jgi:two-component system NtrC family sensor kinase